MAVAVEQLRRYQVTVAPLALLLVLLVVPPHVIGHTVLPSRSRFIQIKFPNKTEDNNVHAHLYSEHVKKVCVSRYSICKSNDTKICGVRLFENEYQYKDYQNSCYLFLSNMCDNPGFEYHIAWIGTCEHYKYHKSLNEKTTTDGYDTIRHGKRRWKSSRASRASIESSRQDDTTHVTASYTTEAKYFFTEVTPYMREMDNVAPEPTGNYRRQKAPAKKAPAKKAPAKKPPAKKPPAKNAPPNNQQNKLKLKNPAPKKPAPKKPAPNNKSDKLKLKNDAKKLPKKPGNKKLKEKKTKKLKEKKTKKPKAPKEPKSKATKVPKTKKTKEPKTTKSRKSTKYFSTLYRVETAWDGHICPLRCPTDYKPICLTVNRGHGIYYKFFSFINHCLGDIYYCLHSEEFAPPPDDPEMYEDIIVSSLSWSFCGASRYLNFARFAETASSMGHYGWLLGEWKATHIMEPHEKVYGYG